jgi:Mu-like prophage I protein
MKTLLQLTKERDDAVKALAKAKTSAERKAATAAVEKASDELAELKAKMGARRAGAAATATATTATSARPAPVPSPAASDDDDDDDDDEEEEEESEESDDEPRKPMEDDDGDDDDDDDDGDDDDDDDDEEEEEEESDDDDDDDSEEEEEERSEEEEEDKARAEALDSLRSVLRSARTSGDAKAIKAAKKHSRAVKAALAVSGRARSKYRQLRTAVSQATGRKGLSAMVGAVAGLANAKVTEEKNAKQIAKLRSQARRRRIGSMLAKAVSQGKIVDAQIPNLREQGMKDPKFLKAFLSVQPKLVTTTGDRPRKGRSLTTGELEGTAGSGGNRPPPIAQGRTNYTIDSLDPQQRSYLEASAAAAGKTLEEYVKAMNDLSSRLANRTPTHAPRR